MIQSGRTFLDLITKVSKVSFRELKTRVDDLAATISGLQFNIDLEAMPKGATEHLIWVLKYSVTYQRQTTPLSGQLAGLGRQIASWVNQLGLHMSPDQIDKLHKVQTWKL